MKTVITGSIAFDYLMSFPGRFSEHLLADQLENISVSFLVDSMRRMRGGVAPNIAYTNALLGGTPTIMASAGRDFTEYGQWLEEQGVDTSAVIGLRLARPHADTHRTRAPPVEGKKKEKVERPSARALL